MNQSNKVILSGAGLVGSLMACYLAKQGYEVEIYEKRGDMRKDSLIGGKSINLALSHRGIRPLDELGITQEIMKIAIPMKGRLIHNLNGSKIFQPYGKDESEVINSVSRGELNKLLMTMAEKIGNGKVNINFNKQVTSYNSANNKILVRDTQTGDEQEIEGIIYLSAEGAGSDIRSSLQKLGRFNYSQKFLEHGYKELVIPADDKGEHVITKNALHIWPRGTFMLIALPNPDGSFTATIFLPFEGKNGFDYLQQDKERFKSFFKTHFSDALKIMPTVVDDFFNNPVGILGTVKCHPWFYEDKVLLIGDAAHAIVPFYGQGMNAGFEDCYILNELISERKDNWDIIFKKFTKLRKINTDAIADLAEENFIEMRDHVADEHFLLVKEAEMILYERYSEIISKYSMVTFSHQPYSIAKMKGDILVDTVAEKCRNITKIEELDIEETYETVIQRYKEHNLL